VFRCSILTSTTYIHLQANIGNKIFTLIAYNNGRWMHTHLAMFQAKLSPPDCLSVQAASAVYADGFAHRTTDGYKEICLAKVATSNSCSARLNNSKPKLTSSTNYNTITGIVVVGTCSYMT